MTYIYNWAIWEYPIQKEIVCMAMNQMAPGMQIFEATVCWKNWAPEADYFNQKPPKLKEITVTLAAISVLFLLLPVLLARMVPRMSFGALASLQKPNAAWQSHIVTWHVQTLVGVPKLIKRNTPTAFLWRPDKVFVNVDSCWSLQTWCLKRVWVQDPKKYIKEKCGMVDTHRSLAPTCTSKEAPAAPFSLSLAKMPAGLVGATAGSSWSNPQ